MKKLLGTMAIIWGAMWMSNASAAPVGLVGDTIDAAVIRTITDPYYGGGRICCYGLDAPFQVLDGSADQRQYSSSFKLDVDNLSFDIDFLSFNRWQDGIVLRLSGLNFLPGQMLPFDLVLDTNLSGLTWSVGADFVDINLYSFRQTPTSYIHGHFAVAEIPEPGAALLLLAGLLASVVVGMKGRSPRPCLPG